MVILATCSYEPDIAQAYGVEEAILLKNFDLWTHPDKSNPNDRTYFNGRFWTNVSIKEIQAIFYHMSPSTVRRTVDNLIAKGLLLKDNFNIDPLEKTLWYALTDKSLLMCRNQQMEVSKSANNIIYIPYYYSFNNKIYIKYNNKNNNKNKKSAGARDNIYNNINLNNIENITFKRGALYGKYNNIPLTDKQFELIQKVFPRPGAEIPWGLAIDTVSSYFNLHPERIEKVTDFYDYITNRWNFDNVVKNYKAEQRAKAREENKPKKAQADKPKPSSKYTQEQLNSLFTNLDEVNI